MEVDRLQLSRMLTGEMRGWLTASGRQQQQFLAKLDSAGCTFAELLNHALMQRIVLA